MHIPCCETVDGVEHIYHLSGTQVHSEEWTENGVQHLLIYIYDASGAPIGMAYRDSTYVSGAFDFYLFAKNVQGDILYIYNTSGTRLVTYTYDAWGNVTTSYSNGGASTAARYNPFRYRGYYYDTETGFYYLNSRYYDPAVGRFLNADGYINGNGDILGFNMFAYCGNNPVNRIDESGALWIELLIVVALAMITLSSCTSTEDSLEGTPLDPRPKRVYDTYDEAVKALIEECYAQSSEIDFANEYGAIVFQYSGDEKYYSDGPQTDGFYNKVYFENKYPHNDPSVTPVAFIHTHPQNVSEPFSIYDYKMIKKYNIDSYVVEKSDSGMLVRMLPKTANQYDLWSVYKWD